ncbi:hypothetical protein TcG_07287 [Trypanosoma cruzi]|nr:hypothetical protein TcG_07287 [Trypanosoma cruzi]
MCLCNVSGTAAWYCRAGRRERTCGSEAAKRGAVCGRNSTLLLIEPYFLFPFLIASRWSAACLNNTSAVVCIDKLTPSSRTLTRGAPQGTVLAPIMFVVVMQSRCCPSNVPYFAEDPLLTPSPPSHSRATGIRSTRPQKKT